MSGSTQHVTSRYLKRSKLQRLLEQLFPGQKDFQIEMRDDKWVFTVPEKVSEDKINKIRDNWIAPASK